LEHGTIETEDRVIREHHLPERIQQFALQRNAQARLDDRPPAALSGEHTWFDEVRRLIQSLVRNNFNRTDAAADLGYSRTTLYHKLDKLKLN
jgi:DNA-binding NtrC family response regulator